MENRKIASIITGLGSKLKAYFLLILSIGGFAFVAYPISIDFLPKKGQKLAKKGNSLITYIFWAKNKYCKIAIKVNRFE